MKFQITTYDDYCVPLLQSDANLIDGKDPIGILQSGVHKALILEFRLPSSSYATMVVREITKLDTSTAKNTELQNSK